MFTFQPAAAQMTLYDSKIEVVDILDTPKGMVEKILREPATADTHAFVFCWYLAFQASSRRDLPILQVACLISHAFGTSTTLGRECTVYLDREIRKHGVSKEQRML